MLYFVDETWQEVNGRDVGALAAVAIPRARYNGFCSEVWQIKHNVLGAEELSECEVKGTNCFAKAAFRYRDAHGESAVLQAAEEVLDAVKKYKGAVFAVWTTHEDWLLLRNPDTTALSQPYRTMMRMFKDHKLSDAPSKARQGLLFFDHRGKREDLSAGCSVQNFLTRVGPEWSQHFMQVPHFTPSAISPGIQAADLVAYLTAHRHDPSFRPELGDYWKRVEGIAFNGRKSLRSVESDPRILHEKKGQRKQAS